MVGPVDTVCLAGFGFLFDRCSVSPTPWIERKHLFRHEKDTSCAYVASDAGSGAYDLTVLQDSELGLELPCNSALAWRRSSKIRHL